MGSLIETLKGGLKRTAKEITTESALKPVGEAIGAAAGKASIAVENMGRKAVKTAKEFPSDMKTLGGVIKDTPSVIGKKVASIKKNYIG